MSEHNRKSRPLLPQDDGTILIPLTRGLFTITDNRFPHFATRCWHAQLSRGGRFYAARWECHPDNTKTHLKLHRLIMEEILGRPLAPNEEVDHVDGDGLNNRANNLRLATRVENGRNRGKNRNNHSGFKGVSWKKANNKWVAQIMQKSRKIHLGYFNTPEDAHEAYCTAARELHGEFARFE